MKCVITAGRIAALVTDDYTPTGQEEAVIDAPGDVDPARLSDYVYADGRLTLPESGPLPLTRLEFLDRFTDEELLAVRAAAQHDAAVELWLWRFDHAENVSLADPRTVKGVEGLEQAGLLAAGRAAEILGLESPSSAGGDAASPEEA